MMRPSHDPTYPLYPVFSFLSFTLCLVPLPWHIQAWNSGTCAFMIWTAMACLNGFINCLIWSGSVDNVAPVWCDISSKIIIGVSIGIPSAILCISRRLYSLTSVQTVSVTRDDKRRMVIVDLCIAVGIPFVIMVLHYIVQGHRFDILEDIGCYPVVYNTLPAYFLYFIWPVVLGAISFVYSGLTLRSFWIRRAQFSQLMSSNTSMSMSRYLRLMILAIIDMMFTIPLGVFVIYIGNKGLGLAPWISWEDTHFNFSRVGQAPSLIWRSSASYEASVELTRWLPILCAFLFFVLFGFASEAKKHYSNAFWALLKPFGFKPASLKTPKATLPSWVKPLKSGTGSTTLGSLPVYTPKVHVIPIQKKQFSSTFTTSFAETEMELETCCGTDIEKRAGLSSPSSSSCASPPAYTRPPPSHIPLDVNEYDANTDTDFPASPTSSRLTAVNPEPTSEQKVVSEQPEPEPEVKTQRSNGTLRTVTSRDRFYVAEGGRARTPSPAPFSDVAAPVPGYHRPFSPPNIYPLARPHVPLPVVADGIHVTIHTISRSTESLRP